MSAEETVKAAWSGPFEGELESGEPVRPGDVHEVSRELAEQSGHWTVVEESTPELPVRSSSSRSAGGED